MPKTYIRASEAARRIGVNVATVKRWAKDGKIDAVQTPGGYWMVEENELERLGRFGRLGGKEPSAG